MPFDAPAVKIAKARGQGAEIVLYDRLKQRREDIAAHIAGAKTITIIPPGDDPFVIAGQGTAAAEAMQALAGIDVDLVLVPCGGGGLAAGSCLAVEALRSKAQVWAGEPADFDDTRRSLASGRRETNERLDGSICDALLASTPAELPFEINRRRLSRVIVADDVQVLDAVRFTYEEFRVVMEPGGAVALAALLADPDLLRGRTAVVILSGGNVDAALFIQALGRSTKAVAA